jgi:hypothetical protein
MIKLSMNKELERTKKEAVVAYFKVISLYFPGRTHGNHENPQSSGESV